jgi:hypothetical protein
LALAAVVALASCASNGSGGRDGAAGGGGAGADAGGDEPDGGGAGVGRDPAGGSGAGGAGGAAAGAGGVGADDGGPDAGDTSATAGDAGDPAEGGAAGAGDGGGAARGGLCTAVTIGAPAAAVSVIDNGKTVDEDGFTGGALASGTYWLTSVTHFGTAYTGPTREIWIVDAAAKTLEDASLTGTTATYVGYALDNASDTVLSGLPSCGASAPSNWNYVAAGSSLSINLRGSSDVRIFTKQP